MSDTTNTEELRARVKALMPQITSDIETLVAIPSVSIAGYPESTHAGLAAAEQEVTRVFADAGVEQFDTINLPGTAPIVYGEIPAPPGAPTVLLYGHYDVVGVGDESLWETSPFVPTRIGDAIHGRGTADTKGNIAACAGAIRAWGGRPPVGVKIVVEGLEEVGGGAFTNYPAVLRSAYVGRVESFAETGSFRLRAGARRMRSPAGTRARSRLPVRSGLVAGSGRTRALGSRRSRSGRSSARALVAVVP